MDLLTCLLHPGSGHFDFVLLLFRLGVLMRGDVHDFGMLHLQLRKFFLGLPYEGRLTGEEEVNFFQCSAGSLWVEAVHNQDC